MLINIYKDRNIYCLSRSAVERELSPKKADRTIYLAYTFNDLDHSGKLDLNKAFDSLHKDLNKMRLKSEK